MGQANERKMKGQRHKGRDGGDGGGDGDGESDGDGDGVEGWDRQMKGK